MKRTPEQELKPVGRLKHQCRICKRIFSCGQELDEHMQSHDLNKRETTTVEPLCTAEFLSRNSNFERGACSSDAAAAGGGEPVDSSLPPPPQWCTEEEDAAHCLLELSNSGVERAPPPNENLPAPRKLCPCKFCNKVFLSHQALGGHRATHKNVKGCYAASLEIRSLDASNKQIEHQNNNVDNQNNMARSSPENMALSIVPLAENSPRRPLPLSEYPTPHICKVCFRQFSNGQALGGHMRCHKIALKITNTAMVTAAATAAAVNSTISTVPAVSASATTGPTAAINSRIITVATASASAAAATAAAAVNSTITTAAAFSATAPTFATDAELEASSNEVNAIQPCRPNHHLLFKNSYRNIDAAVSATATTFATKAEIGASRSEENAIQPCSQTFPLLFKNSYRNIDLNMPPEPIDDMDGSSLQLWYPDVKSPQHGRDREPRRKKNLGDLRIPEDEDGSTPWLQLGIGSMSAGEGERESAGQRDQA